MRGAWVSATTSTRRFLRATHSTSAILRESEARMATDFYSQTREDWRSSIAFPEWVVKKMQLRCSAANSKSTAPFRHPLPRLIGRPVRVGLFFAACLAAIFARCGALHWGRRRPSPKAGVCACLVAKFESPTLSVGGTGIARLLVAALTKHRRRANGSPSDPCRRTF